MSLRIVHGSTVALIAGVVACAVGVWNRHGWSYAAETNPSATKPDAMAGLVAEVTRLKGLVPDQSHVMADVAYHFNNLWFAGQNDNWPLAQFYSDETLSHLRWAVRVIPVRKDRQGREVDLVGILTALEQTSLKDLDQVVKSKDKARFTAAYNVQLENCMACHRAASKEFIRLHIPERPDTGIVEFRLMDGERK